jgi:hypothetical protein
VCLGAHLAHLANWPCVAFGCSSCQLALPCPCCSCVSLRLFVRLGTHVANSPCIAFGRPCCELALRCVRVPNLGEAVLKNLPPSQNWFLSVLRLVFLPSAPLCGRFRYSSSCVLLRLFVRFVTLLCAFGLPSCQLALHCVWVPLFPTRLALPLVAQPWPGSWCVSLRLFVLLGAHVANSPCVAFGRPSCELALRCARAPNLGEDVLKNIPPSQNWFLSVLRLLFLPSAPFVWPFSLRLFVRFVTALPAFRYGRSCVPLRLFVRLAAHLANWPCIAFGCPSCQLALPSPWSLNLGQAPRAFRYGSSCVWVPMLRSRLALRLGVRPY